LFSFHFCYFVAASAMSPCLRSRPVALDVALEDCVTDSTTTKIVVKNTFLTLTGNEDSLSDATLHSGLKTAPASLQPPGCLMKTWNANVSGNFNMSSFDLVEPEKEEVFTPTTDSTQPSTPPAEECFREGAEASERWNWPATPASPLKNRIQISLSELTADDSAMHADWTPSLMMVPQQPACVDPGMWHMDCSWYEDGASTQLLIPCIMAQPPLAPTEPIESPLPQFWPHGVISMPPSKSPRLPLKFLLARDTEVDAPPKSPSGSRPAEKDCYQ